MPNVRITPNTYEASASSRADYGISAMSHAHSADSLASTVEIQTSKHHEYKQSEHNLSSQILKEGLYLLQNQRSQAFLKSNVDDVELSQELLDARQLKLKQQRHRHSKIVSNNTETASPALGIETPWQTNHQYDSNMKKEQERQKKMHFRNETDLKQQANTEGETSHYSRAMKDTILANLPKHHTNKSERNSVKQFNVMTRFIIGKEINLSKTSTYKRKRVK